MNEAGAEDQAPTKCPTGILRFTRNHPEVQSRPTNRPGLNPAGITNATNEKSPINNGFYRIRQFPLFTLCLELDGIKRDDPGRHGHKSPGKKSRNNFAERSQTASPSVLNQKFAVSGHAFTGAL